MRKTKLLILPMSILLILMMAGAVNAACEFVKPTTGTTITGTYVMNVTCANNGGNWNLSLRNCSISASSSRSGDSETFYVLNDTTAGYRNYTNTSVATIGVWMNAEDWAFTGTCYNGSAISAVNSDTVTSVTGVDVDNGNPFVMSMTAIGEIDDTTKTVTATVPNASSYTCTHRGNVIKSSTAITQSFTGTSVSCVLDLVNGNNTYNITVYDGISYTTAGNTYNMITGQMYSPDVGTGQTTTETVVNGDTVVPAQTQVANVIQRFLSWLRGLFRLG